MTMAGRIRIDELNPTELPNRGHELPAMRDGIAVKLTAAQILELIQSGDIPADAIDTSQIADEAVTNAKLADEAVTNAKLAEMAEATIKGRAAGADTGAPVDLTAAQVSDILKDEPWAFKAIGELVPLADNIAGVAAPPTDRAYRYIRLTAADSYNTGVLTGESVSGSAPLIVATAVVDDTQSPINGQTVRLINTERRFLRAGSAGTVQDSANLSHNHTGGTSSDGSHSHNVEGGWNTTAGMSDGTPIMGATNVSEPGSGTSGQIYSSGSHNHSLSINSTGGDESRGRNVGVTYYMRIR